MIEAGIRFKPAQYILQVLQCAERLTGEREYLTKDEVCHCIFNDLRCTRDNENPLITWNRIVNNRKKRIKYVSSGDVIRYAGDILDYMEIASLVVTYDNKRFYLNKLEEGRIIKFVNSRLWFDGYDKMIENRSGSLSLINSQKESWFNFVNQSFGETDFETDLVSYISASIEESQVLKRESEQQFIEKLDEKGIVVETKEIGDMGESLVYSHECQRIKIGGRSNLLNLIKRIPTQYAVGYDIQSVELDERKRLIEVKTTISSKPLHFNKIHLTPNEWSSASTYGERYFVYRLILSKYETKLFILQDPVGLYKKDVIQMNIHNGADITFSSSAGVYVELLKWTD